MRSVRVLALLSALITCCSALVRADISVTYTIDTGADRTPISPYIYGINWGPPVADSHFTIRRNGGNRLTGYNWENNFSNAGNDYLHSSPPLAEYLVSATLVSALVTAKRQATAGFAQTSAVAGKARAVATGGPSSQQLIPGICLTSFHPPRRAVGQTSILTLQMAGYPPPAE